MEMCRSGRSSAADLSACVSASSTSEPALRCLASAADVGTRVRKEKREQHHTHTLPGTPAGCWPSSATIRPRTSQASQCGAKSRTARHLRTFPFCCFTKCYNTQSLKARSTIGLRPTPRKWASRTVHVSGAHISEWTQHKGTGRACPFGETPRRSLRRRRFRFSFSSGSS